MSIQFDDITFDEQDHLNYGVSLLKGSSSRQQTGADFNTTMPVSVLNALPRGVQQLFHPSMKKNDGGINDVKSGRYITILFTLWLLIYLYFFGNALAGPTAGCWAMLLGAIDPNILAHSRLVTTDLYSALFFVAVIFHLHQWLALRKERHFFYCCIMLAIAQCCKINNILLYPICLSAIIAYQVKSSGEFRTKKILWKIIFFILIHLLIINSAFLFYHSGKALASYNFRSNFFSNLQFGWFSKIPIPLPQSFIDTYDLTKYELESFKGTAQNYLNGELRYKNGFWNYYLVCWVVKTPLSVQLLIIATIVSSVLKKAFRRQSILFLIIPILISFIFLSNSSVQSGYRYLLPVLSLSLIAAGIFIQKMVNRLPSYSATILVLVLGYPALANIKNFIAYTSEWQWPKRNAYLYLSDSNLNWGQRQKKIQQILQQNPTYLFEPDSPDTGKIVVDINKLTGIIENEKYKWLRNNHNPIAVIEGCYLLYDIRIIP
ncbi:MAG: ArnT family glycosyltransferase [Chitinophagaceae bacterium]